MKSKIKYHLLFIKALRLSIYYNFNLFIKNKQNQIIKINNFNKKE